MDEAAISPQAAPVEAAARPSRTATHLWAVTLLGCAALLLERLWLAPDLPLWLDETWTASIVSQQSWSAFWREVYLDPNAPLYYLVMHVWTAGAGVSDLALRIPSLLFVLLAAALPLAWRPHGLSREAALAWAALIFCWVPGIVFSLEARGYTLLLLISTAQTIAYARLLKRPTNRRASLWCGLAAAAILTHYFAGMLAAVQGFFYLALHRRTAVRTWPAALAFLLAFGWLLFHLPRLMEWSQPDITWLPLITLENAWAFPAFLVGPLLPTFLPLVAAVLLGSLLLSRSGNSAPDELRSPSAHLWWTAAAGLAALALALAIGALQPSLTPRYLTPLVPTALLALVLLAGCARRAHFGYTLLVGLYLAFALKPQLMAEYLRERGETGYQRESERLAAFQPNQLVFAADSPGARVAAPRSLADSGAFFFKRAGLQIGTVSAVLDPAFDPNRVLLANATASRPVILWIYHGDKSAARRFPPSIDRIDPRWSCEHRRSGDMGIVSCAPKRLSRPHPHNPRG